MDIAVKVRIAFGARVNGLDQVNLILLTLFKAHINSAQTAIISNRLWQMDPELRSAGGFTVVTRYNYYIIYSSDFS